MLSLDFDEKMRQVDRDAEDAKMAAMTLPARGICLVDDTHAVMDKTYFKLLGEYSSSLPTGKYIGKRWKCNKTGSVPYWKCSVCGMCYSGWRREEVAKCQQEKCDGVLVHLEVAPQWVMGEYYKHEDPKLIGIKWRKILIVSEE